MTQTNYNYIPTSPSEEERELLVQHLAEEYYFWPGEENRREAESLVARAAICVFDKYVPDGPGTTGNVMMVVWSGGVGLYEAYLLRAGKIEPIIQEIDRSSAE